MNIMLTMLLGGLWHGAGWPFIFWGALHGGAPVFEHRRLNVRKTRAQRQRRATAANGGEADELAIDTRPWGGGIWPRLGVFAFITFAWVFFRSTTLAAALDVLAQLFHGWGSLGKAVTPVLVLVIALGIGIQYVPRIAYERVEAKFSTFNPVLQGVGLAIGFLLCAACTGSVSPSCRRPRSTGRSAR